MNTSPSRALFIAGSPFDVQGAKSMGMDVYWHNRVGLSHSNEKKADYVEKSLEKLIEILTWFIKYIMYLYKHFKLLYKGINKN